MFDITPIVQAVTVLLAAVITTFVVPYIRSKTTAAQQSQINAWVRIAVSAAEQICNGPGKGKDKKAYVLAWLRRHGVTVDGDKIDALIEAAVYEMKNGIISFGEVVTESAGADHE